MCHRCEPSAINPNPSCLKNLKYMSFKECPEEKKACYSTETSKSVSVWTNLKIANLELPEPSKNQTLNLLNLNSSSKTELRTSEPPKNRTEPQTFLYRIAKNGQFFEVCPSKLNLCFVPKNRTSNLWTSQKSNRTSDRTRFVPTLVGKWLKNCKIIHRWYLPTWASWMITARRNKSRSLNHWNGWMSTERIKNIGKRSPLFSAWISAWGLMTISKILFKQMNIWCKFQK